MQRVEVELLLKLVGQSGKLGLWSFTVGLAPQSIAPEGAIKKLGQKDLQF